MPLVSMYACRLHPDPKGCQVTARLRNTGDPISATQMEVKAVLCCAVLRVA